jgi:uncharacterized protein (DUF885 family)
MMESEMNDPTTARRLAELADEFWMTSLEISPLTATQLGEPGHDADLPPLDLEARGALSERLASQRVAIDALPDAELADADAVTRLALLAAIDAQLTFLAADLPSFTVDPMGGPQIELLNVPDYQAAETPDQARDMVDRWQRMGPWIDALAQRQRDSIAYGLPPVGILTTRVIDELDTLLARPDPDWPLLAPVTVPHPDWSEGDRQRFVGDLASAVRDGVRPAFERYRSFLREEALPASRDDNAVGLGVLPGGDEWYRLLARAHTTTELEPAELHAIGLAEIERVDAELDELGRRLLDADGLADTLARLRSDPSLYFTTGDQVEDVARRSLAHAQEAIPDWFGRLPSTPCEVVPIPAHEAEHSTIAYYLDPAADGSRPGRYYVNRSHPETRPRYEAEALAFHESVPGHHLQVALAQELTALPKFRRFGQPTAYVEGWGLYAERLADEMGLYSGDLDRIGIASFDGWRASRLVVDTGMHAMGWSRSQAIAFMTEHTALAPNNIANEVDRYIAWPGQALAYKIGQMEILRLRDEARRRLGARFDIRRFHDAVLEPGALPLDILRVAVERTLP